MVETCSVCVCNKYRSTVQIAAGTICEEWSAVSKIHKVLITKNMVDIQLHYHTFVAEVRHIQSERHNANKVSVSLCLSTAANSSRLLPL
jgi:hypothetical protein